VRDATHALDLRDNGDSGTGGPVKRLRDGAERSFSVCPKMMAAESQPSI
jgi:hypothetical protein